MASDAPVRRGSKSAPVFSRRTVQRVAFTLVALAFVAMNLVMTPSSLLTAPVLGFGTDLGVHQVHDMVVGGLLWLALIVPMALQLHRPAARVTAILVPAVVTLAIAGMALAAGSFLFPGFLIGSLLALVALLLHPAGRSVLAVRRVGSVDARLAGALVLGGLPLLAYAGRELARQFGPVDAHVAFVHYGAMGLVALLVGGLGLLAVVRERDRRFAAWTAGLLAGMLGIVSIAFPAGVSSLGTLGGGLLLGWAILFVAGTEWDRRDRALTASSEDVGGEPVRGD